MLKIHNYELWREGGKNSFTKAIKVNINFRQARSVYIKHTRPGNVVDMNTPRII
jgi:hypothetical protein